MKIVLLTALGVGGASVIGALIFPVENEETEEKAQ